MRLKELLLTNNKNLQSIPPLAETLKELEIENCDIRSLPQDLFHHGLELVKMKNNKGWSSLDFFFRDLKTE